MLKTENEWHLAKKFSMFMPIKMPKFPTISVYWNHHIPKFIFAIVFSYLSDVNIHRVSVKYENQARRGTSVSLNIGRRTCIISWATQDGYESCSSIIKIRLINEVFWQNESRIGLCSPCGYDPKQWLVSKLSQWEFFLCSFLKNMFCIRWQI